MIQSSYFYWEKVARRTSFVMLFYILGLLFVMRLLVAYGSLFYMWIFITL
jgi:hypothetical protein